jgi:hypothetical protein
VLPGENKYFLAQLEKFTVQLHAAVNACHLYHVTCLEIIKKNHGH